MAQRLVRRLCKDCKVAVSIDGEVEKKIEKELHDLPSSIPVPPKSEWKISKPTEGGTCTTCNGIGYKSRVAVFEIILIDEKIQELILKSPSEYEIKREARRQGQMTLREDGILKILAGITDFAELDRVVGFE
jgi:type II secretory ATPase GspE/PulE/Tfp pilus assembly ATPase PilB-like protein